MFGVVEQPELLTKYVLGGRGVASRNIEMRV
jgi:hypothetical protein